MSEVALLMRVGILASGNLGFEVLRRIWGHVLPCFVATDQTSTAIMAFAKEKDVPVFVGNPRRGKLMEFLAEHPVDAIFSINYLFLIERDVLVKVPNVINLHGSLLPKYRGRTPHVWAIINNEKFTGVTAHFVDEGCDTGPILMQKTVDIMASDTGADILNKFAEIYPSMIIDLFASLSHGNLEPREQDPAKATFFPKRTPDDGLIIWSWHWERIHNWVRAQAYPYPGAFTYSGKKKIVVDSVVFHDGGFRCDDPDGLVKSICPVIVKTPNGLLELKEIRQGREHIFLNMILGI